MAKPREMGPDPLRLVLAALMVAGFIGLVWALRQVPLPGVPWDDFRFLLPDHAPHSLSLRPSAYLAYTIVGLGITPYLIAAVVFQAVTLLVRQVGSATVKEVATRRTDRAVLGGMVVIAMCMSYSNRQPLTVGWNLNTGTPAIGTPDWGYVIADMLAQAVGTALLVLLGRILTRLARVNGIALLVLWDVYERFVEGESSLSNESVIAFLLSSGAVAVLAGVMLLYRKRIDLGDGSGRGAASVLRLPLGTAGGTPLAVGGFFIVSCELVSKSTGGYSPVHSLAHFLGSVPLADFTPVVVISMGLAVAWGTMFRAPARVADGLRGARLLCPGARPGTETETKLRAMWTKPSLIGVVILMALAAASLLPVETWDPLSGWSRAAPGAAALLLVALCLDGWALLQVAAPPSPRLLRQATPIQPPPVATLDGDQGRCPVCSSEVVDDFAVCWRCGASVAPFVERRHLPAIGNPSPTDGTSTTVARLSFPIDADMARLKLEADGIPVLLLDYHLVMANWFLALALGGIKVQVPHECAKRARAILFPPEDEQPIRR